MEWDTYRWVLAIEEALSGKPARLQGELLCHFRDGSPIPDDAREFLIKFLSGDEEFTFRPTDHDWALHYAALEYRDRRKEVWEAGKVPQPRRRTKTPAQLRADKKRKLLIEIERKHGAVSKQSSPGAALRAVAVDQGGDLWKHNKTLSKLLSGDDSE